MAKYDDIPPRPPSPTKEGIDKLVRYRRRTEAITDIAEMWKKVYETRRAFNSDPKYWGGDINVFHPGAMDDTAIDVVQSFCREFREFADEVEGSMKAEAKKEDPA